MTDNQKLARIGMWIVTRSIVLGAAIGISKLIFPVLLRFV